MLSCSYIELLQTAYSTQNSFHLSFLTFVEASSCTDFRYLIHVCLEFKCFVIMTMWSSCLQYFIFFQVGENLQRIDFAGKTLVIYKQKNCKYWDLQSARDFGNNYKGVVTLVCRIRGRCSQTSFVFTSYKPALVLKSYSGVQEGVTSVRKSRKYSKKS